RTNSVSAAANKLIAPAPRESSAAPSADLKAIDAANLTVVTDRPGLRTPGPVTAPAEPGGKNLDAATPVVASSSLRRLMIPLPAITIVAGLVVMTSVRWDAWQGAAAVQMTDNATVGS